MEGGLIFIFIIAALGLVAYAVLRREREMNTDEAAKFAAVAALGTEFSVIKEEIEITSWGNFSRIALGIAIVVTTFALLGASNIVQQIQAGVSFIGSAILFGLGVALGRKRTYRIYRTPC
jgi:hypothetical protein